MAGSRRYYGGMLAAGLRSFGSLDSLVLVEVRVGVELSVGVNDGVAVRVTVELGVGEAVSVSVGVRLGFWLGVGVGLSVAVLVGVDEFVGVGDSVAVGRRNRLAESFPFHHKPARARAIIPRPANRIPRWRQPVRGLFCWTR